MPAYTNAKTHWPDLFMEIMRNDDILAHVLDQPAIPILSATEHIKRKYELIAAAEKALSWNTNKGELA